MKKTWIYNGVEYTLEKGHGYGQYILNGYHFTDSSVWDDIDNEEEEEKRKEAMRVAETFISTKY